jgi:hypothetical protein
MSRPLHLRGVTFWNGDAFIQQDLFTNAGRIVAEKSANALTVDLDGATLLPGLINAHDHLELNHYPRTKFRDVYDNAHQWGEDVNQRLNREPYRSLQKYALHERCFIGGLKNLLCAATTVVQHGAKHKPFFQHDYPVRVLREYGWTHSLHFSTRDDIVASYRSTPPHHPWCIHLAEGTDSTAAAEYARLKQPGCVQSNTVIIHGVGMTATDTADALRRVRAIVRCPTTYDYLLGTIPPLHLEHEKVLIGSDSRLTAAGDLLDELHAIDSTALDDTVRLFQRAPRLLPEKLAWALTPGQPADFWIVPDNLQRSHIPLIVRDGVPQIGNSAIIRRFSHIETVAATLDDTPKQLHIALAKRLDRCKLKLPGLEVADLPQQKRFWFF